MLQSQRFVRTIIEYESPCFSIVFPNFYCLKIIRTALVAVRNGICDRGFRFHLPFVNLVISCVIISFLLWWYRTGDLSANKFWFIILVASVIIFQCITTDIFVFNHEQYYAPTTTAPPTAYTLVTPNKTTPTPAPPAFQNTMDSMFTQANVAAPPEG
ncbi:uncharacterized protein LOC115921555 isoform X1 [Strongylocentrotus purpuratus]|uniref:Uncharacterized protein n=1 Tax=Strongylocentrotus purpuratus TaxID=7668 RepID=A0A7M7NDP5_STRPU|nr:uncharacterized protein LOC115921555 isoform X1 [Strongylocentrotus purpuratus]